MLKRVLVTGSLGMLGKDVVDIFKKDKRYIVFATTRKKLRVDALINYVQVDLNNLPKLKKKLKEINPDIIIHCAALVDVDMCEIRKTQANILHCRATNTLSLYKKQKTKFIYISTDSVFDGKTGNYSEDSLTNPLNYYAKSKLRGERIALSNNKNTLIIRTNIYGFHRPLKNSLAEWALRNLMVKAIISGFTDVFFNPLYTKQLSRIIKYIVEKHPIKGVINVGSDEKISKYNFIQKIAKVLKKERGTVNPVSVDAVSFKVKRPKDTSLNTVRLQKIFKKIPKVDDGIKELCKDYRNLLRTSN